MTTTTHTWDVAAGIPVVLDDGTSRYVDGPSSLIAQKTSTDDFYYLADGLGSRMAITDDIRHVVRDYTYDVYGQVTGGSGSTPNEFDFAGQQSDDTTGLQYLRARYYDPETGVFISRDPLASGPGWLGGLCAYGASNPATLSDPLGLWPDPENIRDNLNPCNWPRGVASEVCDRGKEVLISASVPSPYPVLAGIGSIIGEYLQYTGKDAVLQYQGAQSLNQMLQQLFIQSHQCAADLVCSTEVSAILAYLTWVARVHRPTWAALMTASSAWAAYSQAMQRQEQLARDQSGQARPEMEGQPAQ